MRALYFEVTIPGIMGWHDTQQAKCFYIPNHEVIIAELTRARHSLYGTLDSPDLLHVARQIAEGRNPPLSGLETPNVAPASVQWIDYEDHTLNELVGSCREFSRLDKIVMAGIKRLLQQAKKEKPTA